MDAEKYLREKRILSKALYGEKQLEKAVSEITEVLRHYNLGDRPDVAFDFLFYALETVRLNEINILARMRKPLKDYVIGGRQILEQELANGDLHPVCL